MSFCCDYFSKNNRVSLSGVVVIVAVGDRDVYPLHLSSIFQMPDFMS